jgi:hypothetical protein
VLFVLYVLVGIVSAALDGAATSASTGVGIVVRVVVGVLTAPLGALAAAVLYFDLRAASGEAATPAQSPPVPGAPPSAL